jgi:hypothetical protein
MNAMTISSPRFTSRRSRSPESFPVTGDELSDVTTDQPADADEDPPLDEDEAEL